MIHELQCFSGPTIEHAVEEKLTSKNTEIITEANQFIAIGVFFNVRMFMLEVGINRELNENT